ncbi:MAG: caspase family protein [Saprospiraceae bacterium]
MPKLTNWHPTSHSWFLGIGIDKYQSFDALSNAVKGVSEVRDILLDKYDLDKECIITLFDRNASKEKIIDTLDDLGSKIKPGDKLIIYYSGHGHLNHSLGLGYWIPIDAKRGKASSYLPNSTIRDYVKGIRAKHILLISDSCFSGSLFIQGAFRTTRAVKELDGLVSRWAICSGRHDEEVYDGQPGENSPFTQSFIDYLTQTKSDSVNVARLADHVIEQTAANYEQLPDGRPMFGVGHQGGQYIFWKKDVSIGNNRSKSMAKSTILNERLKETSELGKPLRVSKKILVAIISTMAFAAIGLFLVSVESENADHLKNETASKVHKNIPENEKNLEVKPLVPAIAIPSISKISDAEIELYELKNYKGRMFPIYGMKSSTVDNFSKVVVEGLQFNDVISSVTILIPSDYEFILYEKKRQKGKSISLSGNGQKQYFPNIGSLLGEISSCELKKKQHQ